MNEGRRGQWWTVIGGLHTDFKMLVMCHKGKLPVTGSPCIFTCPGFWLFSKHVVRVCVCVCVLLSHVGVFVTPWDVSHQALPSMEFSKQEYWSPLPFPDEDYLEKGPILNSAVWLSLAEKHRGSRCVDACLSQTVPCSGHMGLCGSLFRNSLNFSF